jgi:hypothetical protein
MSARPPISFASSAILVFNGLSALATSVPRFCSSCISMAMSNIFLRSRSVSATSGSATTRRLRVGRLAVTISDTL